MFTNRIRSAFALLLRDESNGHEREMQSYDERKMHQLLDTRKRYGNQIYNHLSEVLREINGFGLPRITISRDKLAPDYYTIHIVLHRDEARGVHKSIHLVAGVNYSATKAAPIFWHEVGGPDTLHFEATDKEVQRCIDSLVAKVRSLAKTHLHIHQPE